MDFFFFLEENALQSTDLLKNGLLAECSRGRPRLEINGWRTYGEQREQKLKWPSVTHVDESAAACEPHSHMWKYKQQTFCVCVNAISLHMKGVWMFVRQQLWMSIVMNTLLYDARKAERVCNCCGSWNNMINIKEIYMIHKFRSQLQAGI